MTLHPIHRHVCSGADFWSLEFERSDVAGVDQTNFSDQTTGVLQRKNEGLKPLNASLTHPELDQVQNSNHPELESSRSRPSWFPNSNALTTWNIYANLGIQWDMRHETWDMIHDTWYMTWDMRHDTWYMIHDMRHETWYMIHDTWYMTWDMRHDHTWPMRHETWHMTHDTSSYTTHDAWLRYGVWSSVSTTTQDVCVIPQVRGEPSICSREGRGVFRKEQIGRTKGWISVDRSSKATLLLTIPRSI